VNSHSESLISAFILSQRLPAHYRAIIDRFWLPLAERIAADHDTGARIIGINGAQGTGKTTMAAVLSLLLQERHGLATAVISIDDFYLGRVERAQLAASVHPLLRTRGVPGTHDMKLAKQLIMQLRSAGKDSTISLPRFDKAMDDRLPQAQWPHYRGKADVILFEGWCVGTPAQPDASLSASINALEANEDADCRWRSYINARLADDYRRLFELIDLLIFLKAPDFQTVFCWRNQQEQRLMADSRDSALQGTYGMNRLQLVRFMQHFERLTRYNLEALPEIADIVFNFDRKHIVRSAHDRSALA